MEQQEKTLKRGVSKAIGKIIGLNVILGLISLLAGIALTIGLVKVRGDMSTGTRIASVVTGAVAFVFFMWCIIDMAFTSKQNKNIKKNGKLKVVADEMKSYQIDKSSKTASFWGVMTGLLFIPAIIGTVIMLISDKGQSINALYMGPAYLLGIITLYLAIHNGLKVKMISCAMADDMFEGDVEEPVQEVQEVQEVVQEAPELSPEQLRLKQIAEAQRRAAEMIARQNALAQQVINAQETENEVKAQENIAEEVPAEKEQVISEPVTEVQAPVVETEEPVAPVEQPAEEVSAEPVAEEIPVGEPPVKVEQYELPDLDFGIDFEEEKVAPAQVVPQQIIQGPQIQIVLVTPDKDGKVGKSSPVSIPLQITSGTQTLQVVIGGNDQSQSTYLLSEGQLIEAPKKTRGRKPGSKNSTTKKKSSAKKTTKKSTTKKKTTKKSATKTKQSTNSKTVKTKSAERSLSKDDAVSSALDSIGAKLDKISQELSKE